MSSLVRALAGSGGGLRHEQERRAQQVEAGVEQDRLGQVAGPHGADPGDHPDQQQRRQQRRGADVEQVHRCESGRTEHHRGGGVEAAEQCPQQQAPEQELLGQWSREHDREPAHDRGRESMPAGAPARPPAGARSRSTAWMASTAATPTTCNPAPAASHGQSRIRTTSPKSARSDPRPAGGGEHCEHRHGDGRTADGDDGQVDRVGAMVGIGPPSGDRPTEPTTT